MYEDREEHEEEKHWGLPRRRDLLVRRDFDGGEDIVAIARCAAAARCVLAHGPANRAEQFVLFSSATIGSPGSTAELQSLHHPIFQLHE